MQIILNVFRRKPLEQVLPAAARPPGSASSPACRWPAACSPGSTTSSTTFAADDHRSYNRYGEAFDVGETFSGVPYEVGVAAAREVAALTPEGATTAQLALRWIIDQPGVTTVIPGARNAEQARGNAAAADARAARRRTLQDAPARRSTTSGSASTCTTAGEAQSQVTAGHPDGDAGGDAGGAGGSGAGSGRSR